MLEIPSLSFLLSSPIPSSIQKTNSWHSIGINTCRLATGIGKYMIANAPNIIFFQKATLQEETCSPYSISVGEEQQKY